MNIAVFGYYSRANEGDDRIMKAWTRLLPEHQCTFFLHHAPPSAAVLQHFDMILIGGGGLVWNHVGLWKNCSRWIRQARIPVAVAGLGVNHLTPVLRPELAELINCSEFFIVRDQESHALLDHHPKVQVHPDLSWTVPHPPVREPRANFIAVNLGEFSGVDPVKVLKQLEGESLRVLPFNIREGADFMRVSSAAGENRATEFSIATLNACEMMVCCRYHAVQYAIQTLTPFVAIAYDDKLRRLLREADLDDLMLEPEQTQSVASMVGHIRKQRESIIARLESARASYLERAAVSFPPLTYSNTPSKANSWSPVFQS